MILTGCKTAIHILTTELTVHYLSVIAYNRNMLLCVMVNCRVSLIETYLQSEAQQHALCEMLIGPHSCCVSLVKHTSAK